MPPKAAPGRARLTPGYGAERAGEKSPHSPRPLCRFGTVCAGGMSTGVPHEPRRRRSRLPATRRLRRLLSQPPAAPRRDDLDDPFRSAALLPAGHPRRLCARPHRPGDGRPGDGRPGDGRPGDGRPGDRRLAPSAAQAQTGTFAASLAPDLVPTLTTTDPPSSSNSRRYWLPMKEEPAPSSSRNLRMWSIKPRSRSRSAASLRSSRNSKL